MKKLTLLIMLLLIIITITGCTNPVKSELFDYVNVLIPSVSNLEDKALSKYENMIENVNLSSEEMHKILENDVIPSYKEFLTKLENINLKTEEVKKIHNLYIKGAQTQLNAFMLISEGLKNKDNSILDEANTHIHRAKEYMDTFRSEIQSLANRLKIKHK
ncbi:hypothetical protein SAMN05660462_02522 [Proteiniborus ethanoligenes]|uniref:Lipoprotein n=1 Tax=Proteiniborus ethanoligenes TaxID=415015 RepID=A0A1H3RTC7_9FIRM|nr:hypothetical protein [Proteiniborus ethanoligenes]TAH63433.1 MAG: hypothetical protein EWM50_02690 [Gottschalkiaceae bacterium]SDZ28565.1 hypothetical protein SAMN05660462_02522 [Proteiniborus ethanoligenes]